MFKFAAIALAAVVEARRNTAYDVTKGYCEAAPSDLERFSPKELIGFVKFTQRTPASENDTFTYAIWYSVPDDADFEYSIVDGADCSGEEVANFDIEKNQGMNG